MTVRMAMRSRPLSGKRRSDRTFTQEQFDRVVFAFAKDRLENWIEFLQKGNTDEAIEGPRVTNNRDVAEAAKKFADMCKAGKPMQNLPPSLKWSCQNWNTLKGRMKSS